MCNNIRKVREIITVLSANVDRLLFASWISPFTQNYTLSYNNPVLRCIIYYKKRGRHHVLTWWRNFMSFFSYNLIINNNTDGQILFYLFVDAMNQNIALPGCNAIIGVRCIIFFFVICSPTNCLIVVLQLYSLVFDRMEFCDKSRWKMRKENKETLEIQIIIRFVVDFEIGSILCLLRIAHRSLVFKWAWCYFIPTSFPLFFIVYLFFFICCIRMRAIRKKMNVTTKKVLKNKI